MRVSRRRGGAGLVLVGLVVALVAALLMPATGGASVPGTVNVSKTIKTAGIGYLKNFGDAATGTEARFKRANDNNEVKGYTFELTEFADDNNDPATALSETRRLVSQDGAVAIVPDVSTQTPADYLTQQQIPYFGPGYDITYCEPGGWGFSVYGCLIQENPKKLPGSNWEQLYKSLTAKGIKNPTAALLGSDQTSGKVSRPGHRLRGRGRGLQGRVREGCVPGAAGGGR